jgi:hypothetical protein
VKLYIETALSQDADASLHYRGWNLILGAGPLLVSFRIAVLGVVAQFLVLDSLSALKLLHYW